MDAWGLEEQSYEYKTKPYEKTIHSIDMTQTNVFFVVVVEACQDIEVNETISIDWNREHPRVIWDNDVPINESSCVSCGQCATVCPCNAMMEVNMEGNAGYMTDTEPGSLAAMIDLTKKLNQVMDYYLQFLIQKRKCVKNALRKRKQFVHIVV